MRFTYLLYVALLSFTFSACGNRSEPMDTVTENAEKLDDPSKLDPAYKNSGDITLTPMPPTEAFEEASIEDWAYENGQFHYITSGYMFGKQTDDAGSLMCANSPKGQHVHLIIDNEPYIAKYQPKFDQKVDDGRHYILTFLSRSYHESIKTPAAHRALEVDVENGTFRSKEPITEPMLFYSRPKGTYTGKEQTENVMLDFYPLNVTLGENAYSVKAKINGGDEFIITEWQPYYLKGLPMGENTVELTLMKDGEVVSAPLNPVTRTFTLRALPVEE